MNLLTRAIDAADAAAAVHSAAQRMPGVSKAEIENTLVAAAFLRRASEQLADAVRRLEFLAMAAWAEPPTDAITEGGN